MHKALVWGVYATSRGPGGALLESLRRSMQSVTLVKFKVRSLPALSELGPVAHHQACAWSR